MKLIPCLHVDVFELLAEDDNELEGSLLVKENGQIESIDLGTEEITGFTSQELVAM